MKSIVLTGGGTAGHVTPNLALIPHLEKCGFKVSYIGTENGMEKELVKKAGIDYYSVRSGKLRRYFSLKNFTDVFNVAAGIGDASSIIRKLKPDIVVSKGGFVAVPVVLGAKLNGVKVVAHESDMTPGLANKIASPFAKKICCTFPETLQYLPKGKGINTGTPIREELFSGDRKKGIELCGFKQNRPIALIIGGSQGSVKINNCIRSSIDNILKDFQIVHICGKNNIEQSLLNKEGYKQFEFVSDELKDIFAAADIIISRSGSNSISEFLALKKPNLLIPLSSNASRGDQILNAKSFEKQGFSVVLYEEEMTAESIYSHIKKLYSEKDKYIDAMEKSRLSNGVQQVINVINECL